MDNMSSEPKDAYNSVIAAILRGRKAELQMSNQELAEKSGMPERTFSRLLKDERPMRMGQFIALVNGLGLEPSDVVAEAAKRLASDTPLAKIKG